METTTRYLKLWDLNEGGSYEEFEKYVNTELGGHIPAHVYYALSISSSKAVFSKELLGLYTLDCVCHKEPRSQHGLEGFTLNDVYKYEINTPRKTALKETWTVWQGAHPETMGRGTFLRYFKPITL